MTETAQVKFRRGTTSEVSASIVPNEMQVDTDKETLVVGGSGNSSHPMMREDLANYAGARVGGTFNVTKLDVSGIIEAAELDIGEWQTSTNILESSVAGQSGARIRAAVSSPANPTYSFQGDPATGMYRLDAGRVGFSALGVPAAFVDSEGIKTNTENARVKLGVWDSDLYGIGMGSGYTFGGLHDFATTFQMNNVGARGWWWGHNDHTNSQGAMALNTNGELTVAQGVRVGYGEADTVIPLTNYDLDVAGDTRFGGGIYIGGTGSANRLDDYEEGTWTPTYISAVGSFDTLDMNIVSADYTKIGNLVSLRAYIRTNNVNTAGASGVVSVAGLPFVCQRFDAAYITLASGFGGQVPLSGYTSGGSATVRLAYRAAVDGGDISLDVSDLRTGAIAGQNRIILATQYQTAA